MRLKSLASRLFVLTGVALAPALVIAVFAVISIQKERTADLHADARRSAELVMMEVEQTFVGIEGVMRTLVAAPVVRGANTGACSTLLAETVQAVEFISALYILEEDGTLRCQSDAVPVADFRGQSFFTEALATGNRITGTMLDQGDGAPLLPVALRIAGRSRDSAMVAVGFFDLTWMETRLQRRSLPPGGALTIVDRSGTILARVPQPEDFIGTKIRPEYMYLLEEEQPGSVELVSSDGTNRVVGYFPPAASPSGVYVSAGFSTVEGYAVMREIALQSLGLALLGTALASVLAYYTARHFIARPVGVLLATIADWRRGITTSRTGMSAEDGEMGEAGAALDAFMSEVLANREARKKADEARDLMRDELEHREKNLLATVQAIARQTFSQGGAEDRLRVFSDRLNAISEANQLLKQSGWQSTSLRNLILSGVSTFVGENLDRVVARGPDLVVKGNVATALGMSIHELCTNAVKYGALSNDTGRVMIEWDVQPPDQGGAFTLLWTERGGPPVTKPERTGFGSKVIRHALSAQTGGTVEITHEPEGLVCRLTAPAEAVIAPAAA